MIYFIQQGDDGPVKIGYVGSKGNLTSRLSNIQACSPEPLKLLGTIDGSVAKEKAIHAALSSFSIRGEWFEYTTEILNIIQNGFCFDDPAQGKPSSGSGNDEVIQIRCHPGLKAALQKRANLFQMSTSAIARWGLEFAARASIPDLLNFVQATDMSEPHSFTDVIASEEIEQDERQTVSL